MFLFCYCRLMLVITVIVVVLGMPSFIVGQASTDTSTMGTSGSLWKDFWIVRLSLNILGYATIVLPGYLIIRYARKSNYLSTAGRVPCHTLEGSQPLAPDFTVTVIPPSREWSRFFKSSPCGNHSSPLWSQWLM